MATKKQIQDASDSIKNGMEFVDVVKRHNLSDEELIQANNAIPGFQKISEIRHRDGEILAW